MPAVRRDLIYSCRKCPFNGKKTSALSHFIKLHVEEDGVPYVCRLCGYRALKFSDLKKHVGGFKPHQQRKAALDNSNVADNQFFIYNPLSYEVKITTCEQQDGDLEVLSRVASEMEWEKRRNGKNPAAMVTPPSARPDLMRMALQQNGLTELVAEEDFIPDYDDIALLEELREEQTSLSASPTHVLMTCSGSSPALDLGPLHRPPAIITNTNKELLHPFTTSSPPSTPKFGVGTVSSYVLEGFDEMWEDMLENRHDTIFPYRTSTEVKTRHGPPNGYQFQNIRF